MKLSYLLLLAMATCWMGSAFSESIVQEEKSVTMTTVTQEDDLVNKPTLSERVHGIEERLDKMDGERMGDSNPLHGYVNLEALCWKGKGNDQIYAFVSDEAPVAGSPPLELTGKVQKAENKWSPGSRLAVGFTTNYHWNIGAIWTYYHNESVSRKSTDQVDFLPVWVLNNFATSGKFHYHLNYNTVDWQFANNCCLGRYLTLTPFVDVRAAWIKSTDRIRYRGLPSVDTGIPTDTTVVVHHGWWGIGPRVGSAAAFKFGKCGFSVFGDLSGSLLYGTAHDKRHITQNTRITATNTQAGPAATVNWRESFKDLRASLEMMVGAKYQWDFDHGKKAICLHAAWEANYWWGQGNSLDSFVGGLSASNGIVQAGFKKHSESLILYGINVGLGFAY